MEAEGVTSPSHGSVSVLFVCLGNICRSPMAEGVFRSLTKFGTAQQHPLIRHVDSCGTAAYHTGSAPDVRTLGVLQDNAIDDYRHQARKVAVPGDFERFDYILAMDEQNLVDLRDMVKRGTRKGSLTGSELEKLFLYGRFGGSEGRDEEIDDPYYGGRDGFRIAFEQVSRFGQGLLKHIEDRAAAAVTGS